MGRVLWVEGWLGACVRRVVDWCGRGGLGVVDGVDDELGEVLGEGGREGVVVWDVVLNDLFVGGMDVLQGNDRPHLVPAATS